MHEKNSSITSSPSSLKYRDFRLYKRLLGYVYSHLFFFFLSIVGFIVYSLGNVLLADLMQFLLDALNENVSSGKGIVSDIAFYYFFDPGDSVVEFARFAVPVAAIFLALTRAMGFFFGTYYMNHVSRSLIHTLRCQLFNKFLFAPISKYDQHSQGELVSKLTFNVEQVSGAVSTALKVLIRDGLTVIALAGYLFYLNWQLSLLFFAVSPLIAAVVVLVGRYFRRYSRRIQNSMGDVTHLSSETLQAPRDIRLYGAQSYQSDRFSNASDYNRRQSLKLTFAEAIATPVVQTLLASALSVLIWFALSPELINGFSVGSLVAFLTAAGLIGKPIRSLSGIQVILQRGLAASEDIFVQIDSNDELDTGDLAASGLRGKLVFQNVSFRYPDSHQNAIEDISFEIEAGQSIAIVGPSGSGKSTLVQLLAKFYSPDSGEISLDEVNINRYRLIDLRSQLSFVSQDATLFRDTVFNNIAFGELKNSSMEMVRRATDVANATDFIEALPKGFNTVLIDSGESLSGGERQRIAIARAVLKNSPIFILDEATSALDNESEYLIKAALDKIMLDRTSLVIAHRLSTIENADRILVFDKGKIVASGNHSSLLAEGGLYAQLYNQDFSL